MLLSLLPSSGNNNNHKNHALSYALAAWGGIALTTGLVRWSRRRQERNREANFFLEDYIGQCQNAVEALAWRASRTPDKLALEAAHGSCCYSWAEYYQEVQRFAKALLHTTNESNLKSNNNNNMQHGVAVHAFNEPRWFFCALGALAAEWTISGIYLTNTYAQAVHIINTSDVKVLVLESQELLESTYATVLSDFKDLTVVLLQTDDDGKPPVSQTQQQHANRVCSYSDFLERGDNNNNQATLLSPLKEPGQLDPNARVSNIFTSGTTGNPKAVELTHENVHTVCAMMHARIPLLNNNNNINNEGSSSSSSCCRVVSYLPLSHIAAMGIDMYSSIYCGASVHFADSDALRGSLKDTLLRVRPTLFFGVPRVWEKMAAAMQSAAAKSYSKPVTGKILQTIGSSAKAVGRAWWSADTPEWIRCLVLVVPFGFFKMLAFRKVRKGCGLDRCRLLYTGAAPLSADTLWYLRSLDMPLLEVFGMSESAGAIAVCGPNDFARPVGACGRALPMGELTIAESDSEILWKGNNNMVGYKGLPAATAGALNANTGCLHTGDVGKIDESGYLFITGRKKDLIITAGGENVAPVPIEESFMSLLHGSAGHVVLIGDQRKFLTVVIAPTETGTTPNAEQVELALKEYNTDHSKSRAQQVQKAHVLEFPFSVESGELTPTMKLKRAFVVHKYTTQINSMYQDGATTSLVGYSSMNIGKLSEAI